MQLWADERIMQYTAEVQKRTKGLAMITTPYSEVLRYVFHSLFPFAFGHNIFK